MNYLRYSVREFGLLTGLGVLYAVLAKVVLSYFSEDGNVTLIWFSGGVGLAALLILGQKYWPGIFAGAFAAGMMVDDAVVLSLAIASGNLLESLFAYRWLRNHSQFSIELTKPAHYLVLTVVAAFASVISASVGPVVLAGWGMVPWSALPLVFVHWWMADVFGIIAMTPILLIWRRWPAYWFTPSRWRETAAFIVLTLLFNAWVFLDVFETKFNPLISGYWIYALMFWGAMRFGCHGVTWIAGLATILGLFGAAHHVGYFAYDFHETGLVTFWFYIVLMTWIGIILALTLRKNSEINQALQASERRLQAILDASPVPYAIIDDRLQLTFVNPAFSRTFAYTLSDISTLDQWWMKACPEPAYHNRTRCQWWDRLVELRRAPEQAFSPIELEIVCKGGERKTALLSAAPLSDAGDANFLIILYDITENLASRRALAESHALLHDILETLPLRVFWKDRDLRYVGCNSLFAHDAGFDDPAKIVGKTDAQLAWRQHAEAFQSDDRCVIASGEAKLNYEAPQTTAMGDKIWLRASKLPLRDSVGQINGVVGIYDDISVMKRQQDELADSLSMLQATFEATNEGILVVDLKGRIRSFNQRFLQIGQIPKTLAENGDNEALLAFMAERVQAPDAFIARIHELYQQPDLESMDTIELTDGRVIEQVSKVQRIGDSIIGRVWSFRDITARKRIEEQLLWRSSFLEALLESSPDGILTVDHMGRKIQQNRMVIKLWDIPQAIADNPDDTVQVNFVKNQTLDPEVFETNVRALYADHHATSIDEIELVNGTVLERYSYPINDRNGQYYGRIWQFRDITERKRNEAMFKLAALVFENSSEAMLVTDGENRVLAVNPAFTRVTGYTLAEVLGKSPGLLRSGIHDDQFYAAMWQSLNTTGTWHGEINNRRKSGEIYCEELSISTIFSDDGKPLRRVALFSDVTARKQSEEQIWLQANFDPLTGLPNRRMFRDRLETEIRKAHRMGQQFALLFIDLDRFKEVNDTLGHENGDALLKLAAERLQACVRESDTIARLGGDEFTVILSEIESVDSPKHVAEKLLAQLTQAFHLDDQTVFVSASIGVTLYPDDGTESGELLKYADQAMYAAKSQGRNGYRFFTPALQAVAEARAALLNDLYLAVSQQQFSLNYQPIVDLATGEIRKAEALLRWQHPVRGMISPDQFIPLAEESGLINVIGDWVFKTAAEQLMRWRHQVDGEFQIGINKSPTQFNNPHHDPASWLSHLKSLGVPESGIVVEITENLLLDVGPSVAEHLLVFRDAGMQVAIDDFGTGYSALSYLTKLDIDYLKIDRSFVRNLGEDANDFALCEAIVAMAHKLGLKVVAEGVETIQQRDMLIAMGCDFAQGYLFARPLPPDEFERRFIKAD